MSVEKIWITDDKFDLTMYFEYVGEYVRTLLTDSKRTENLEAFERAVTLYMQTHNVDKNVAIEKTMKMTEFMATKWSARYKEKESAVTSMLADICIGSNITKEEFQNAVDEAVFAGKLIGLNRHKVETNIVYNTNSLSFLSRTAMLRNPMVLSPVEVDLCDRDEMFTNLFEEYMERKIWVENEEDD